MAEAFVTGVRFTLNGTQAPREQHISKLFSCQNKTAIVTGAAAGIGLIVAQTLAEAGANVAIWYHSNKDAVDRAEEIQSRFSVKCMYTWSVRESGG